MKTLNDYSVKDLKKAISNHNIKGYSKMNKPQIIKLMLSREHYDKFKDLHEEPRKVKMIKKKPQAKQVSSKNVKVPSITITEEPTSKASKIKKKEKASSPVPPLEKKNIKIRLPKEERPKGKGPAKQKAGEERATSKQKADYFSPERRKERLLKMEEEKKLEKEKLKRIQEKFKKYFPKVKDKDLARLALQEKFSLYFANSTGAKERAELIPLRRELKKRGLVSYLEGKAQTNSFGRDMFYVRELARVAKIDIGKKAALPDIKLEDYPKVE